MKMQYNPETQELELDADEVARVAALKALYAIEDEEEEKMQQERSEWLTRVQRLDNGQIFQPPKNDRVYQSAGYTSQVEGVPHASKWDWWQATVSVESWGTGWITCWAGWRKRCRSQMSGQNRAGLVTIG